MLIIPAALSGNMTPLKWSEEIKDKYYHVFLDKTWCHRNHNNKLYIYSGWALSGEGEQLSFFDVAPDIFEDKLRTADGYYCLIIIDKNELRLIKSLYRYCDIYYTRMTEGWIAGTHLEDIFSICGKKSISSRFVNHFLADSFNSAFISPFDNILKAYSGCLTHIDHQNINTEPFVSLTPLKKGTLEVLATIMDKLPSEAPLALYLSGGLDSSLVFFTLLRSGREFDVLHCLPFSFETDTERVDALRLCRTYGVKMTELLPATENKRHHDTKVNHPSDCQVIQTVWHDSSDGTLIDLSDWYCLDGHGGDSVFIQSPSVRIVRDLAGKGHLRYACKMAHSIGQLKSRSVFSVIMSALKPVKSTERQEIQHPLLRTFPPGTAWYDYIHEIVRVSESMACRSGTLNFSPLLSLNVIRSRLSVNYEDNISSDHDRAHIRRDALEQFRDDIFIKKTKRSSSQLICNILRQYESELILFVSRQREKLNPDFESVIKKIKYNTHVELDSSLPVILSIIKLMKFMEATGLNIADAEVNDEYPENV
ncbi:asparagine synthase-related protein [Enterobacter asburiae]